MHHSMHLCILHHNTIVVFSPTITNNTVTIRDNSGVVVGTHSVSGSNQVEETFSGLSCDNIYDAQVSVCTSFNCVDSETISEFYVFRLWH